MEPDTDANLRRFLDSYDRIGAYALAPALTDAHGTKCALAPPEYHLQKRALQVRHAWQIGRHDLDGVGVGSEDDPIIPAGVDSADIPVHELQAWFRSRNIDGRSSEDAA